jgi:hypothetical protein
MASGGKHMSTCVHHGSSNIVAGASIATSFLFSAALGVWAVVIPTTASAATWSVTNCNDSGAGSLRAAVALAASGDIIDLRQLSCGEIKLAGQEIQVAQNDLTIIGPGPHRLILDADYKSRILAHGNVGTLRVYGVSLERGYSWGPVSNATGGCLNSAGSVHLERTEVRHCWVNARNIGKGGGVYAEHDVTAIDTAIYLNKATGTFHGNGAGIHALGHITLHRSRVLKNEGLHSAGIFATGGLTMAYSTIADNHARDAAGAAYAAGDTLIAHSTISGNYSDRYGGALMLIGGKSSIVNSTISGNVGAYTAAVFASDPLTISNSTIAGNITIPRTDQPCANSVAVRVSSSLQVDSSIVADTSCSGAPATDLLVLEDVSGSDNLVERVAVGTLLPPDTLSVDPMLAPLADNGGVRLTRALLPGSPAIDTGSNPLNLRDDQRWGFPRTNGPGTDIGAYER